LHDIHSIKPCRNISKAEGAQFGERSRMTRQTHVGHRVAATFAVFAVIAASLLVAIPTTARAAPASILVHRGTALTALNCSQLSDDWQNFPIYVEQTTGAEMTFRHDGSVFYMLIKLPVAVPVPEDYWGMEFDVNGDHAHMGSSSSPDDAVFASAGCPDYTVRDAFLSGFAQPTYDETAGGHNDVVGLMSHANGEYTIQITRPLVTGDSAGHDAVLSVGTQIGVGFVAGRFGQGASHKGTDMSTYVLSITNETSQGGGVIILMQANNLGLATTIGQLLFFGALGLCAYHFVRRRAWRPRPYESKEIEATPLVFAEVRRHELGMRLSHWSHVGLMTGLLITGFSINQKTYILGSMTTPMHLAFAFSILFIDFPVHFISMWRGRDLRNIFLPKKDDITVAVGTTANFFYLSKKYPEHATWDPKEKKYYLDRKYCSYQKFLLYGDLIAITIMGITGLGLYFPESFQWLNSLLGGSSNIRALQLFLFYYFAATVAVHLYLSLIPSNLGRLRTMVTGTGKIRLHTEAPESRLVISKPPAGVAVDGDTEMSSKK